MHAKSVRLALLAALALPSLALAQQEQPQPSPSVPAETPAPTDAAQQTGAAGGPTAERKAAGEEIIVTGSRVRRKDLNTPAPVTVINRLQISSSGVASIGDFLQQMPEQGGATNTSVNNGGDGQTQVSLRNLGPNRTLVLVDGKRWVNGGSGSGSGSSPGVDLNSIPTAAIERVEVLKDGASAVYGSDAIGGVVNIITRRKVNGAEVSAYAGLSPHGDAQQYDGSVTAGATGDKGSFLITGEYFDQKPMLAANRSWSVTALSYDFDSGKVLPGGSGTIPNGRVKVDPSKCTTQLCQDLLAKYGPGSAYFSPDPSGAGTVDGWRKYDSSKDLYNFQAVNYLITPNTRYSLFTNGDYRITDSVRAYLQGSLVNRQSQTRLAPEPLTTQGFGAVIAPDNQYNPFGIPLFDARRRLVETGGRLQGFDLDTVHGTAGFDGTLPEALGPMAGTFFDVSFNFGRTSGVTSTNGSLNTAFTANGLGSSYQDATGPHCGTDPAKGGTGPLPTCTPVNLFGGAGTLNPAMLAALGGYTGINQGFIQIASFEANASKELFRLASERPVGLGLGYQYRREYGGYIPNSVAQQFLDTDFNGAPTRGSFYVNEGYAEVDAPLASAMPLVEDLELQAALRVFDYSTFGRGSTYKLGARFQPIHDVVVRGTYSTGFRAPSVGDLYGGAGPASEPASDPCSKTGANTALKAQCLAGPGGALAVDNGDDSSQIASTTGGAPTLKPETAKTATLGAVFQPTVVRNFSLTVDYWNVAIDQNLGVVTTPVILAGCYPASIGSSAAPNQTYCSQITRSTNTGAIINVNDFQTNVGETKTSGLDVAARYTLPTDVGRFGFLFDSTYLLVYDYTLASGKTYHSAGNYDLGAGVPAGALTPRLKFNVGGNYGLGGFNAGIRGRYIGGFDECADAIGGSVQTPSGGPGFCTDRSITIDPQTKGMYPTHRVDAYATFDLFASYLMKSDFGSTTFSAGMRNVLDKAPPRVFQSFIGYADTSYDFVGRFMYARLEHRF